jgi:amino acid adenylation domain-containing protein
MNSAPTVAASVRTFLNGFHNQVELRPHAPAVTQREITLTYGQLDCRANALAQQLLALGVGPETLVGLMIDRNPDMVVGLLGILKTGAAYVPLDPAFPAERLSFMLSDAKPAVVVTQPGLRDCAPPGTPTILVDGARTGVEAQSVARPPVVIEPWTRAYVIYTSGSTGRPKGVEITHGALANLLDSFATRPGMTSADVVLAHTTLSFDIAVIELWLPLFTGARIVLADPERGTDGRLISDLLARSGVTFVQATPALWRLVLDAGWQNGRGVTALSGGEPLSRDLANALLATGADLWNVYGPTETTVWSSLWHVDAEGPILIGHPIRNTELYVLDADLNPVPAGEPGELCIGGAGLARGYLNHPALTADRFPRHPFSAARDARLYRTGDRARSHGDAGLECLGRLDLQIKIDGFRVEPGEVEAVLSGHDAVEQAIVCARERSPGDRRLVAYVVHGSSAPPKQDELVALARAKLPAYMVPSAFVMLRNAPLTPSGKIDRESLPRPDWRRASADAAAASLRTPLQRRLAEMWRDILGISEVAPDDNFFDVGGRSRLGAQLFIRIETELGPRLPLATLFEAPTLAGLARAIEQSNQMSRLWRCLVPITPNGSGIPLFCVHPVGGNVLAYRDLARHLSPVPCYGLQAVGLDGRAAPLATVEDMASRYIDEIRSVRPHGPYQLCGFSFGGLVAFEMAVRLRAQNEAVSLLALLDTDFPDCAILAAWPGRSPLFRRRLYPFWQQLRRHGRSLRRLGPRGYLRAGARSLAQRRSVGSRNGARADSDRFTLLAERVRKANTRAAIRYVPARYDGALTYFRAQHRSAPGHGEEVLNAIATHGELVDIEGGHSDLRLEPQVQIVAREMLARMDAASQATR